MMKKLTILAILTAILAFSGVSAQVVKEIPNPQKVGTTSEIHVTNDGKVTIQGAYVQQVAGSTFYLRIYWGDSYFKVIARTNSNTKITRKYGGSALVSEIKAGDFLTITGKILEGSDSFNVIAETVKDWSLQDEKAKYSGKVASVGVPDTYSFTITLTDGSLVTVHTTPDTDIVKGSLRISVSELKSGDKITSATGVYKYPTKTLEAKNVVVYQDQSLFWPKNFEGKLESISSLGLPTILSVNIDGQIYNVYLGEGAVILNKNKETTTLQRFVVGDTVRFYGMIRKTDLSAIDAEVVRNKSL